MAVLFCGVFLFSGCGKKLDGESSTESSGINSQIWSAEALETYYECELQFFVNPEKPKEDISANGSQYGVYGAYGRHVMDNMIKLLESESFTEKLILNGEPLPEKGKWANLNDEDEAKLNLDNLIEKAEALIIATNAESAEANAATDIALAAWRETAKYKSELAKYKGAVSYSYRDKDEDMDDGNNLVQSFICVTVSVLDDREFAENMVSLIKGVLPEYVEANMPIPSEYSGTNCQLWTRDCALKEVKNEINLLQEIMKK